jgi:membrane-associated phospholipid phosphatase
MKQLLSTLHTSRLFYRSSLFFIACAAVLVLFFSKPEGFMLLNSHYSFAGNVFFVNYTFLGDGIFALGLTALLYYRKQKRLAVFILAAYLSSGITVQLLKNIIYTPGPSIYFEAGQYIYHLDNFGNSGGGASSFPSGHTTSAFALATVLALWFRKKWLDILLVSAAALVGYSRIYLAQHAAADVLAGSCIGILFGTLTVVLLNSNVKFSLPDRKKYNRPAWNRNAADAALS